MEIAETKKRTWIDKAIKSHNVEWTIRKIIESETDKRKVTAIAMPAGTGKSSYVKKLISEGAEGLIIVTDRVKQVKNYFTYEDDNGESSEFDIDNAMYLTSENLAEAMPHISHTAIVVMTMARYFSLSTNEIISLSRWKYGTRNKVIIDEMPPLIEEFDIGMKELNDVHTAIFNGVDDTANQQDKDWAINQWKNFKDRLEIQMDEQEKKYSADYDQFYLWFELNGNITEDDSRFFSFINSNEKRLTRYSMNNQLDVMATLNHIQLLRDYGSMFSCRLKKSGEYVKGFTVTLNNLDRLINLVDENGEGLKVYILDGTSDLSPDYRQYGIDIIDCTAYYRDISSLTINIIDINTSKKALTSYKADCEEMIEIKRHISSDSLIISHLDFVDKFADCVANPQKQLAHFNAIRGDNDYNQMKNVIQIGLNRKPPIYYLLLHKELHPDFFEAMFDKPTEEYIEELNRIIKNQCRKADSDAIKAVSQEIYHIMEMSLLADIEQNIFRTAIRNYNDDTPVVCTLIFDVHQHTELINQMRKRFEAHGAKIIVHEKSPELKLKATQNRKAPQGQKQTNAQKVLAFIGGLEHGQVFKIEDMLKEIGISNKQLKTVRHTNQAIFDKFKSMQTDVKGYYKKP